MPIHVSNEASNGYAVGNDATADPTSKLTPFLTATSGPAKIDFTVSNTCAAGATCVFKFSGGR